MPISLTKGGNVSLSKAAPGLIQIRLGLGWNARSSDGANFDLDASAFLLKSDGRVRSDEDFIFYNALTSVDGSVTHSGDNRDGIGDGDDETIRINLPAVPSEIEKVVIGVSINEAAERKQNFGMVSDAFVRVVNEANGDELVRYDLTEDFSIETALIFGEIYRHSGDWKFRAVGQGFQGGLGPMARQFGVKI